MRARREGNIEEFPERLKRKAMLPCIASGGMAGRSTTMESRHDGPGLVEGRHDAIKGLLLPSPESLGSDDEGVGAFLAVVGSAVASAIPSKERMRNAGGSDEGGKGMRCHTAEVVT